MQHFTALFAVKHWKRIAVTNGKDSDEILKDTLRLRFDKFKSLMWQTVQRNLCGCIKMNAYYVEI